MDNWRKVKLGELGELNRGKSRHRPRDAKVLYGGVYPFIQTGDIKASNGRITEHSQTYSEIGLAQSRLWPKNTMVITIAANIAETAILKYPACFPDSVVGFIADEKKADIRFIEYRFRLLKRQIQHENVGTGSVQDNINLQTLNRLEFFAPSIEEQKAIADFLATLDDKIDLNRQMNETLEAMARAIFKDWFVDFGPTRAKMEGRAPYLAPEIWSLFPDRLDGEGKPVEWGQRPLRYLGSVSIGGYWGDDQRASPESINFLCLRGVDLEHLRDRGECPTAPIRWGKISTIEKRQITSNDVLIAASGAGPCGRSLWLDNLAPKLGSFPTTYSNFVKLISCRSAAAACFLDRILLEMRRSGEIWSYVNGTSVPNLNDAGLLDGKLFIIPPESIMAEFAKIIRRNNEVLFLGENSTLAATRDLLLPKLMSGELRIKDAEKMLEAVA